MSFTKDAYTYKKIIFRHKTFRLRNLPIAGLTGTSKYKVGYRVILI